MATRNLVAGIGIGKVEVGERFAQLTTIGPVFYLPVGRRGDRQAMQVCQCDCGTVTVCRRSPMTTGEQVSCGCQRLRSVTKHGDWKGGKATSEYSIWLGMRARCYNKNSKSYHNYGGRGIKVCQRWLDSFESFLLDMGRRPSRRHTIERIDNDGDYEPANCKWATYAEQGLNRRDNRVITFNGETMPLIQWARKLGVNYTAMCNRFQNGWPIDKALTTTMEYRKPRRKR